MYSSLHNIDTQKGFAIDLLAPPSLSPVRMRYSPFALCTLLYLLIHVCAIHYLILSQLILRQSLLFISLSLSLAHAQTDKKTRKCFHSDFNISTLFPFSVYKMPNKKKRVKSFGWDEVNRDKNKKQINEEKKVQ